MGWDLRSGLDLATGNYVAFIDGDDQFKPQLIVQVYKKIIKNKLDFVKTRRLRRDDGLFRAVISLCFNLGFLVFFGAEGFWDVNSKPKIMKSDLLKAMILEDNGWFIDAEIMLQAKKLNANMGEVGVRFYRNKYRDSFVGFNAIVEMSTKLLSYKYKQIKETIQDALNYWRQWLYWPKTSPAA